MTLLILNLIVMFLASFFKEIHSVTCLRNSRKHFGFKLPVYNLHMTFLTCFVKMISFLFLTSHVGLKKSVQGPIFESSVLENSISSAYNPKCCWKTLSPLVVSYGHSMLSVVHQGSSRPLELKISPNVTSEKLMIPIW